MLNPFQMIMREIKIIFKILLQNNLNHMINILMTDKNKKTIVLSIYQDNNMLKKNGNS